MQTLLTEKFFRARFVRHPTELPSVNDYWIFRDENTSIGLPDVLPHFYPNSTFLGILSDVRSVPHGSSLFIDGPTWSRRFEDFALGTHDTERVFVILHFETDPTGYWDFAKACGPHLRRIFVDKAVDEQSLEHLSPLLKQHLGIRCSHGRLIPAAKTTGREYRDLIEQSGHQITRILHALTDDKSRTAFTRVLFGTPEQLLSGYLAQAFGPQQYMDVVQLRPGDHIVNCGVGLGWELPYFLVALRGDGRIYNFDPNIGYQLSPYADMCARFEDRFSNHRVVLTDFDGEIELPTGQFGMVLSNYRDRKSEASSNRYPARTVDALVKSKAIARIDYLKVDVEGGEPYLLRGAMASIKRFRPKIALSIYHEVEHLWELPSYLLDNLTDYRYYVRQHGFARFETILYAIPAEDVESVSEEEAGYKSYRPHEQAILNGSLVVHLVDEETPKNAQEESGFRIARIQGGSWALANLETGPRIHGGELSAIAERPTSSQVIQVTTRADGYRVATIGRFRRLGVGHNDSPEISWGVPWGLGSRKLIPLFGPALGDALLCEYDPSDGRVEIMYFDKSGRHGSLLCKEDDAPLYVAQVSPRVYKVALVSGARLRIRTYSRGVRDAQCDECTIPGRLRGVSSVVSYVDSKQVVDPALMVEASTSESAVCVYREKYLQELGRINLPAGNPVTTVVRFE